MTKGAEQNIVANLLAALEEAEKWIATEIDHIGPNCDHDVGICLCGDKSMLASIRAAISKAKGEA